MKFFVIFFVYILFLNENVASSYVPPVENVTVVCHSQHPVVYWNHSQPELQPRFSVTLRPYYESQATEVCTNTSDYHCDVFAGSKVSIDDEYMVIVTVIGQNESLPASDVMFTYDRRSLLTPCTMDLPSVNISVQPDHQIKVHFLHPYHVYKDVFKLKGNDYKTFYYSIITKDQRKHAFSCHMKERACEARLAAEEEAETHCVDIQGHLHVLTVSAPGHICIENPPPVTSVQSILIYVLVPVAVIIAVVIVLYLLINRWTNHSWTLPKSLMATPTKWLHQQVAGHPLRPEETSTSPISETPTGSSSQDTSLLLSPERCTSDPDPAPPSPAPLDQTHFPIPRPPLLDQTHFPTPSPAPLDQTHFPTPSPAPLEQTHFPTPNPAPPDQTHLPIPRPAPQSGGGDVQAAPSGELDCTLVDYEAEGGQGVWDSGSQGVPEGSGYERRERCVSVEMDLGDMVKGYK